ATSSWSGRTSSSEPSLAAAYRRTTELTRRRRSSAATPAAPPSPINRSTSSLSRVESSVSDVDIAVLLGDGEFAQADALVPGVGPGGEAELEAVPRADDVQIVLVEALAAGEIGRASGRGRGWMR